MNCANPKCRRSAEHLFDGTLWLVELETLPEARILGNAEGFPVCGAPSRYFWLCSSCSSTMAVVKWTSNGLVLRTATKRPAGNAPWGPKGPFFSGHANQSVGQRGEAGKIA